LGLSALLHDIGKVRTPLEVLNKPGALTPAERVIMRRHPVDGAAILRASRDIPRLAPIVAFEHHLRQDGQGYPSGVLRTPVNVGTVICSIADAYDAMRSTRVYQPATPADRIMEIMIHNDGTQFEAALVRRFIRLMGVYPPSTLVRLTTGEVGVVIDSGSDNAGVVVRIILDPSGARLEVPQVRHLESQDDEDSAGIGIETALDPKACGIDPADCL
jgi:HD-GYP domain-containing protein (c-di-GMP phosphodiesterase class II)